MDEEDAQCDKLSVHAGHHHHLGVGGVERRSRWMDEVDAQCDKLSVHAGHHHQLGVGGVERRGRWTLSVINYLYTQVITTSSG